MKRALLLFDVVFLRCCIPIWSMKMWNQQSDGVDLSGSGKRLVTVGHNGRTLQTEGLIGNRFLLLQVLQGNATLRSQWPLYHGRFEVKGKELGHGAFGVTYLAEDTHSKQQVVVKIFYRGEREGKYEYMSWKNEHDQWALKDSVEECRKATEIIESGGKFAKGRLAACEANHISDASPPFLVLEYAGDQSLKGLLASKPEVFDNGRNMYKIAIMMLQALVALKQAKYVHCDIKPDNIMVTLDTTSGKVTDLKFIDFGLTTKEGATVPGGTIAYMAPELLKPFKSGKRAEAKDSLDLFAIGATLRELMRKTIYLLEILPLYNRILPDVVLEVEQFHSQLDDMLTKILSKQQLISSSNLDKVLLSDLSQASKRLTQINPGTIDVVENMKAMSDEAYRVSDFLKHATDVRSNLAADIKAIFEDYMNQLSRWIEAVQRKSDEFVEKEKSLFEDEARWKPETTWQNETMRVWNLAKQMMKYRPEDRGNAKDLLNQLGGNRGEDDKSAGERSPEDGGNNQLEGDHGKDEKSAGERSPEDRGNAKDLLNQLGGERSKSKAKANAQVGLSIAFGLMQLYSFC